MGRIITDPRVLERVGRYRKGKESVLEVTQQICEWYHEMFATTRTLLWLRERIQAASRFSGGVKVTLDLQEL